MRRCLTYAPLLVLCIAAPALAETAPRQDPNDAVFTATAVVIVAPDKPDTFTIERSYRGDLAIGSKIELPKFKLITYGLLQEPHVQPLTDDTRILMFLRPDAKNPAVLEITDWGYAYFTRDVAKIDELEAIAKRAIALHKKWQDARDLPDRQDRVEALFPYLLEWRPDARQHRHTDRSCRTLTLAELAKLNPASGDYLATRLATVSPRDREHLLQDISELPSPAAHGAAIVSVDRALERFSTYLADHNLKTLDARKNWLDLPEQLQDDYAIAYYGLAAVASFKDPTDLPYFRRLVSLLVANNFDGPLEMCLRAMAANPVAENVPVLVSIWEGYGPIWQDFKARNFSVTNAPSVPIALARASSAHKDRRLIPVLLEMLDNPIGRDFSLSSLRELTGKDFRTDAEWRAWYAPQPAAKTK